LQLVQLQLPAKAGCILLSTISTFGCLALGGVSTVGLCLEAFGSDDEKGIDFTNLIVTSGETGKEVVSGTFCGGM